MLTFVIIAGVLTALIAALLAIPLLKARAALPRAPYAAAAVLLVLAGGGAGLYAWLSNWPWNLPPPAVTPENMVASLARRLEKSPDDLAGWLQLGRSYIVLQQYPLAQRAYQRADRLAGGHNADALVGLAEALALADESELDGRASRLLEQALTIDPHSPKALYYGALTAMRRGDLPSARQRFQSLLDQGAPANVEPVLKRQIAALDEQIKRGGTPGAATQASGPQAAGPASAHLLIKVTVAPALHLSADSAAPLFVLVREPGKRGPPLAVKRLSSQFPQSVELSPADAMLAGHTFKKGQDVEVVARISRSGTPIGATGDPFGLKRIRVGDVRHLEINIDQITP